MIQKHPTQLKICWLGSYLEQTKTQNYVKCLKYDDCASLHRFHILYISYDCDSKIELFMHFFLKNVVSSYLKIVVKCIWILRNTKPDLSNLVPFHSGQVENI